MEMVLQVTLENRIRLIVNSKATHSAGYREKVMFYADFLHHRK